MLREFLRRRQLYREMFAGQGAPLHNLRALADVGHLFGQPEACRVTYQRWVGHYYRFSGDHGHELQRFIPAKVRGA